MSKKYSKMLPGMKLNPIRNLEYIRLDNPQRKRILGVVKDHDLGISREKARMLNPMVADEDNDTTES